MQSLPGILLVIEYFLLPPSGPVLHVGQGADPTLRLYVQLRVVDLNRGVW